jgi:hypothetical protein
MLAWPARRRARHGRQWDPFFVSGLKKKSGGRACKPDSVPHANRKTACLRGDHSSRLRFAPQLQQPTRGFYRAGPALPSYLALHHAGFSVPPMLPSRRWALTPPFHPCQTSRAFRRRLTGFPVRCHRASLRRRSILCGTFRSAPSGTGFSLCSLIAPPGVTRRVALYPKAPIRSRRVYPEAR